MTKDKEDKGFLYKTFAAIEDNLLGAVIAALVLGSVGTWTYNMYDTYNKRQVEQAKIVASQSLHTGDLNNNGLVDRFYLIDGKPAVVELDGKLVVESPSLEGVVNQ
ncbi:MAG: hypothetical protein KJ955_06835 [Nanoarchaeota archaeon]|nr:hypothetical protein [Nanoarchaeota archaeon]